MVNWGSEDLEICLRLWLLDYEVVLVPQVEISHLFRPRHPYSVNWMDVIHNMLRMVYVHFNTERAKRVITTIRSLPDFELAYQQVHASDVWDRRQMLELNCKHDDNWFFDKFGPKF
jgi:GT2 family glycosyltransferase